MRYQNRFILFVMAVAISFGSLLSGAQARGQAGEFDYYTMALSWSPSFCETRAGARSRLQCNGPRAYAFVLHGVWPQYNRGWPSNCYVRDNWVPQHIIDSMLDIMPSKKLVIHEYKKHGTCSGLSPKGYYEMSRKLFDKIKIPARYLKPQKPVLVSPEQIEKDFLLTNKELKADMISIACKGSKLQEVRICFDRKHNLTPCGANENQRKLCKASEVIMPPVRVSR